MHYIFSLFRVGYEKKVELQILGNALMISYHCSEEIISGGDLITNYFLKVDSTFRFKFVSFMVWQSLLCYFMLKSVVFLKWLYSRKYLFPFNNHLETFGNIWKHLYLQNFFFVQICTVIWIHVFFYLMIICKQLDIFN